MNTHAPMLDSASPKEMAFVLFVDIVKYALLPAKEQTRARGQLKEIAKGCDEFRLASQHQELVSRSTGDGLALVFFSDPAAPLRCAIDFTGKLKLNPSFKVRMGIHFGPVQRDTDINDQSDVGGPGINIAQRVMDFGDEGHILMSRAITEFLLQLDDWKPNIFLLGEGKDKHGQVVIVYNYYNDEVGNSKVPVKLRSQGYEPVRIRPIYPEHLREAKLVGTRTRYHSCGMLLPDGEDDCVHCGKL